MKISSRILLLASLLAGGLALAGCKEKSPAEKAGEAIGDAAEKAADATKDAAEKVGDAIKDATN